MTFIERIKPLPETYCLECNKLITESNLKGYLKHFCNKCLQIDIESEYVRLYRRNKHV